MSHATTAAFRHRDDALYGSAIAAAPPDAALERRKQYLETLQKILPPTTSNELTGRISAFDKSWEDVIQLPDPLLLRESTRTLPIKTMEQWKRQRLSRSRGRSESSTGSLSSKDYGTAMRKHAAAQAYRNPPAHARRFRSFVYNPDQMTVSRRRLIQSLALTAASGAAAEGAEPAITLDVLRNVSALNGTNLSDDRLRVIKPVLEHNRPQLQALREFEVDDAVAPTQGILEK